MARILVTEEIADGGLERLRQAGHTVDIQLDLSHEQLLSAVKGAHALIIRSATDVNAEVLEAGTDLVVVGRAGVGLDNVGACRQVLLVDFLDHVRLREHQQFVVAFYVVREIGEARAAILRLAQVVALDHGTHRAIENRDAAFEQRA